MSCNDIKILTNPNNIDIKQSSNEINVNQSSDDINISQVSENIEITQVTEIIYVCAQNPVFNNFIPFFFIAIQDQKVFTLPNISLSIWVNINGTSQSQAKTPIPDFTVEGNLLTLSEGVDEGDTVFGMLQIL